MTTLWTILGEAADQNQLWRIPQCDFSGLNTLQVFSVLCVILLISPAANAQVLDHPPMTFLDQPRAGSPELQGNAKVLLCQANGVPEPVYRWKKDGRYMTPNNMTETTLRIQNIQIADRGEYQCTAANAHGAIISNTASIRVAYIVPFANSGTQDHSVEQGKALIINLPPLDSFPEPNIQWYEGYGGGDTIHTEMAQYQITLKHQLVLLAAKLTDNGKLFKATAKNTYTNQNSDTQSFKVNVMNVGDLSSDLPPEIVIPPLHTTTVQSDDTAVILECVANARPLNYLSLTWYKVLSPTEKEKLQQDNIKYFLSFYGRRLTIKNPESADTGRYECEAAFTKPGANFPPARAQANITVSVKPVLTTTPPSDISQDVGTSVTIPCSAMGVPTPNITWYRNAELITPTTDTRYTTHTSGDLEIANALPEDSGMFQCFVSNSAGMKSASSWLKVLSSAPEIVGKPQNTSVIASDRVRFRCEVTGAPKPTIWWYRVTAAGSEDLVAGSLPGNVQVLARELLLTQVQVADAGRYYCNATNNKGTATAAATLTVTERTRIVAPPQDASVIKGSTTILQCGVTHDEQVTVTWSWFHITALGTEAIPRDDERRRVSPSGDGSLEIRSVRNDDIGQYRCEVTSAGGNTTAQATIKVIELPYAPTITSAEVDPDSKRSVLVKWKSGFDGNSPIKQFIVQYRLVPPETQLYESEGWVVASGDVAASLSEYLVTGLAPARSYQFRVSAVNDVGEGQPSPASVVIDLPQEPPSGPPRGVVGSPRSNSSIIIQWQPPDEDKWNGRLAGYLVRYKPSNYPDQTLTYENITNLGTMYELKGLIVFQEYEISVAAYNQKGVGVYSDNIRVRTREGKPTVPPSSVAAQAVNSTAVKLTWLPPDSQFLNGINLGYKVLAVVVNDSEAPVLRRTILSDMANMLGAQEAILTGLLKYTEYNVTIVCFTSSGDGPASAPVVVHTLEDVPDAVGSLEFSQILDTSLKVMWTPPPAVNGHLVGYTLSYMKKNETITKVTRELEAAVTSFTIQGLTATTVYTIQVLARTRVGSGPARTADIESGVPPEKPDAPRNLGITNIRATSVLLQFIPGFNGHTSISRWSVQAQTKSQEDSDEWETVFEASAPDANSLSVTGLTPYTTYRLRMLAVNIAGQSPPSQPSLWFDTIQAPPASPPQDVTVRAVNETALRVRWTPLLPQLWHGLGRGYRLQVKMTDGERWDPTILINDENANSYIITGLEEWTSYSVRAASQNTMGLSGYSPAAADTTREAVPSAGPANVSATALSSTSIRVSWQAVPASHQNGMIRGYKVEYSSSEAGLAPTHEVVKSNSTLSVTLTQLKKYVAYDIAVLAYTRIGDGALSSPPLTVRTIEDLPGPPSRVYFPSVTWTTASIHWSPPREPNGIITGYSVSYRQKIDPPSYAIVHDDLPAVRDSFDVAGLQRDTFYVFSLKASTALGWGEPADVEVRTIVDRRVPEPPNKPQIGASQIGDRWVTISWHPGNDGYGPIRNYTIQTQRASEAWTAIPDYVPSNQNSYTVTGLKPNTLYRFRVSASNDVGMSGWSNASEQITTKQAAPEAAPVALHVTPQTTTSVLVTWKLPPRDSWNGELRGFHVEYRELDAGTDWRLERIFNPVQTELVIGKLTLFKTYEVKIRAFNNFGETEWSPVYVVYLEMVPTASPQNVAVVTESSTAIRVTWDPPSEDTRNGDLLGYKIYYWKSSEASSRLRRQVPPPASTTAPPEPAVGTMRVKTVAATETAAVIDGLEMFTQYALIMLAFNAAGDGPNTTVPITAGTDEGKPGPPGPLVFTVTSLDSLNVTWDAPLRPNGIVDIYEISYYQDIYVDGESRSVQVKIAGDKRQYTARELSEDVTYIFSVRAKTRIGWGLPSVGNITTGPQPGSPPRPETPTIDESDTAVLITWRNGYEYSGDGSPITGYIIQIREKGDEAWETLARLPDPEPSYQASFRNLKPATEYQFRVIAINERGISAPSPGSQFTSTADIDQKPFYQQWWFLVIVALTGLIFIIIVVSLLCITGRNKSKYKEPAITIPRTTVQLSSERNGSAIDVDNEGFTTFELRRSQRAGTARSLAGRSTLTTATGGSSRGRHRSNGKVPPHRHGDTLPPYSSNSLRSPPRPSPGSVNYSDPDDDATTHKYTGGAAGDGDSSSLTEKPSDISDSESEADAKESFPPPPPPVEPTYVNYSDDAKDGFPPPPPPPPAAAAMGAPQQPRHDTFTNHYVNGDVRNSWHRREHYAPTSQAVPPLSSPYNAYSYTDSEVDSSQYAVSMNGGHVIMNNMAGSRAPLPGFSSFV